MNPYELSCIKEFLRRRREVRQPHDPPFESLEALLTSEGGFGLTTATPLQRGICRIAEGVDLKDLHGHPDLVEALGPTEFLPKTKPAELGVFSGIRTAKTSLAAAIAINASQRIDLTKIPLLPGERPRVAIVSLSKDNAKAALELIGGVLQGSGRLRHLLAKEPTGDTVEVWHPNGRIIDIKVVAGKRAGGALVSRWMVCVIFDEVARMVGSDEGVVNYDDSHAAVKARMLPGAQIISISSPWGTTGPAYRLVRDHWKRPTEDKVIIKAPAWLFNPVWWNAERCAKLKQTDPDVFETDCLANFIDADEAFFPSVHLDMAMRDGALHVPPEAGVEYRAAIDPATRSNFWTLVIAGRRRNGKKAIVYNRRWQGSRTQPLSAKATFAEIAEVCQPYGVHVIESDDWSGDAMVEHARDAGIVLSLVPWTAAEKYDKFKRFRDELNAAQIELPPDPNLMSDLRATGRRIVGDRVAVVLPRQPDGGHCDYAPSAIRAMARWLNAPAAVVHQPGTPEYSATELRRMEEQLLHPKKKSWYE